MKMVRLSMPCYSCITRVYLMLVLCLFSPASLFAHEEITLQLKWKHAFQFAGIYMALEKGFYDKRELNVSLIEGGPGKSPIDHVLTGDGHFAITDTGAIIARSEGRKVKALAAIFQHSPLVLAVKESSDIHSFADLRGKRLMMQSGHMDAVILAAMKRIGLSDHDFTRQDTSFNLQDLVDGNTDAFSVYLTDQPHQLQEMGIPYRLLKPSDLGIDFYGDILITSDDEIRRHPGRVQAFIEATLEGWNYALDHIDETVELILEQHNTQHLSSSQLYFEAFKTSEMVFKDVVNLGYMSQQRWQMIADTYAELGLIEAGFDISELLYKPEPTLSDMLGRYAWQLAVFTLILLSLLFALQSVLLRRMVKSRTADLQQSETRFRTLVDNVPGAIYRCIPDQQCSMDFISDEVEQITGFPPATFIHNNIRSYRSIIHEDDKARVTTAIHGAMNGTESYNIEYRITHADGSGRWVSESGQTAAGNGDQPAWIDGCIFDITERKKAEQFILNTSRILEMIAAGEHASDIYDAIALLYESRHPGLRCSMLELQGNKLLHGGAPSLPKAYCDAVNGLEYGPCVGSCGTSTYTGQRVIVENIETDPKWADLKDFALPHGMRCCWSEPIKNSSGKVLGAFGMYYNHPARPNEDESNDLTSAARLAGLVMEREQNMAEMNKLSSAIDQCGEVITIADKDGVIEYINPAFTAITGYTQQEAIGKTARLIRSRENEEAVKQMWATLHKGKSWHGRIIEKKRDGSLYPAMLTASPIRNEAGETTHYIGVHEDLSKLEEVEDQFRQAQKMESIGTLVGGIAHDFNNMLAAMQGNLYLARQLLGDSNPATQKLENVERLGSHAADMIRQLLTFARKDKVVMKPIVLNAFMKEAFKLASKSIPENIVCVCDLCEEQLSITGDATQMQQILMNLLNNARGAVSESLTPEIHCVMRKFEATSEFLSKHPELQAETYAHISVRDNGSGIDKMLQEKIFEPFFTTKTVGEGSGLGLAMVYGAIKTHGGAIEVESAPGEGTTFHLYLPLTEQGGSNSETHPDEIVDGNGETLLLVDDEPNMRETTREVLESLNYRVIEAENGQQALELFAQQAEQIALVITDIVMPVMNGDELAREIRELRNDIPIIFSSGYDKEQSFDPGHAPTNALFLAKPFTVENLSQSVRSLLQ